MKRIDIIGQNGNDGLHYKPLLDKRVHNQTSWIKVTDETDWPSEGYYVYSLGGKAIFLDWGIQDSPMPAGIKYYLKLKIPTPPVGE